MAKSFGKVLAGLAIAGAAVAAGMVAYTKYKEKTEDFDDELDDFEENDFDGFLEKLQNYPEKIKYLNPLIVDDKGQRVVRIYDPDGHAIEVKEKGV